MEVGNCSSIALTKPLVSQKSTPNFPSQCFQLCLPVSSKSLWNWAKATMQKRLPWSTAWVRSSNGSLYRKVNVKLSFPSANLAVVSIWSILEQNKAKEAARLLCDKPLLNNVIEQGRAKCEYALVVCFSAIGHTNTPHNTPANK